MDTTLKAIRELMPVEVDEDFYMDVFELMKKKAEHPGTHDEMSFPERCGTK